jgi:drug/metabolite transporter (DMT)-like permease
MPAVVLTLISAFFFALAAALQQREAATVHDDVARSAQLLLVLVRRRWWLAGVASDVVGFVVLVAALAVGRLVIVQPLTVTLLLFALPLSAALGRRRVHRNDMVWAAVLVVSLGVFVVVSNASAGVDVAANRRWLGAVVIAGVPLLVAIGVGVRSHGSRRALALGLAAGIVFAFNDAIIRSVTRQFDHGIVAELRSWPLYALAVLLSLGLWLQQSSYQAHALQASLPAITVAQPIVGVLLGVTLFEERFQTSGSGAVAALVASVVLAAVAVVTLARSEGRVEAELADEAPATPDP